MPPCFWAKAVSPIENASNTEPAAASTRRSSVIFSLLFKRAGSASPLLLLAGPFIGPYCRVTASGSYHIWNRRTMIKERSGEPRLCYRPLAEPDVLTPVAVEDAGP